MKTAKVINLLVNSLPIDQLELLCAKASVRQTGPLGPQHSRESCYDFEDGSLCRFIDASWSEAGRIMQIQDKRA